MKYRLLLLDANVIIYLHELGLWDTFIQKCAVTLTPTVIEESKYWEDDEGVKHPIDLRANINNGIHCVEVSLASIEKFMKKYGPVYLERLDDGEAEALAFLLESREEWLISAADAIVFKTLGLERRAEQGISLEEILNKIGMTQSGLKNQFTKAFRTNATRKGQIDGVTGFGHAN